MQIGIKSGTVAVCICMCLSGCSKGTTPSIESKTGRAIQASNDIEQKENTMFFPESYLEQQDQIKFECQLEVPEGFDVSDFHAPQIKGISNMDSNLIYGKYVEGNIISEEYHNPPTNENEKGDDAYILEDGTLIGFTGGVLYYKPQVSIYRNVVRDNERSAPKDDFEFATGDECVEQVKEELKECGCPIDEYRFDWFSTSGEDYAILEQRALDDGMIDHANTNQDGWTDEDNAYEIYGWQTYEGLQVFPHMMTSLMTRAIENYKKAPVSALYTKQGMLTLSVTYPPYMFEASDKLLEFLSFSKITDVLVQKYSDLLDDCTYTVTRAKLVLRTYYDENDELAAEPVWYFEVTNSSSFEVVLVNAVTGEEIFLN